MPIRLRVHRPALLTRPAPLMAFLSVLMVMVIGEPAFAQGLPAPANVTVEDRGWDDGKQVVLAWNEVAGVETYRVQKRALAWTNAKGEEESAGPWEFITLVTPKEGTRFVAGGLTPKRPYEFEVTSMAADGTESAPVVSASVAPTMQWFDGRRFYLLLIVVIFCGAVIYWIQYAKSGAEIKIRKIAGLEAVDEAVGRATEMGRPILFVPGIQDINEIQTIAGLTVLSHVAKTAAEYDAKVEVPTSRSLVMTTARETVQAAFLSAGRPDAYNQDLIYYVTDEQFGYVAYLSGMMVREKPAACFYMGAFFAESLILAETGNSIGAIQVAGTAMPAQLPFFVAACDYTLIGEEFFAASAYLSGEPAQLGSLKGQDVGKVIVAVILLVGITMATISAMTGSTWLQSAVDYLVNTVLA